MYKLTQCAKKKMQNSDCSPVLCWINPIFWVTKIYLDKLLLVCVLPARNAYFVYVVSTK